MNNGEYFRNLFSRLTTKDDIDYIRCLAFDFKHSPHPNHRHRAARLTEIADKMEAEYETSAK